MDKKKKHKGSPDERDRFMKTDESYLVLNYLKTLYS